MDFSTRFLTKDDAAGLIEKYRAIAANPGGFVRTEDEVSPEFIDKLLRRAQSGGVGIGAIERSTGKIVGSIIARKLGLRVFDHVLSNVIIGVHPNFQSRGIGRRLFFDFLEHVQLNRPDIVRVELVARESNQRQIEFYESIGFRREGFFEKRIRNSSGTYESDIPMAWIKKED